MTVKVSLKKLVTTRVTASWSRLTSYVRRLMSTPVASPSKNDRGWRWMEAKSSSRRRVTVALPM